MTCANCGADNPAGQKFCGECGSPLAPAACPNCGAENAPGQKFCGECGTPLGAAAAAPAPAPGQRAAAAPATPAAERRLVSVLFADLVGFTSASEGRDAEDTRELLSSYFDRARQVIERYGGTVEKFIGDAVMAVWGAPVAQEDDAERAVRAALDLVDTVNALGAEIGAPELRVRGGVLTGEAAVTVGATGQGMVAGDLVNTASRIQSAAEPGTVLVGESTRRATMASVGYEDGGEHSMKGKSEPMQLWRARQVTAGRGGALKSVGLEAPFVGREREFRIVKDLFHSTADERRATLVSVTGVAGIGKSRVLWEFFKYIDGLAETIWWHRGRCLAYGEGVAYWALAEMVRSRCEILEEEEPASALAKLRETLETNVPDAEERAWIEPRLAHMLALEERGGWEREDLFSAWRVFFERLADQGPCVLVFEDLQWGDSGLLDFIEHLLDWSRAHPIFVLTLARPELTERRPDWGAGKRNFTSLFLEPLPVETTDELLNGLAPGLPPELVARVRDRADGVPLYAVETVRMLLDRGVLERVDDEYRVTSDVERLEVPETLHALVAARLDGLAPAERRLLDDAAVLGRTFSRRAVAEVGSHDETEVEPLLASLVRKEILGLQQDPRSPERGQYGFLQALMQRVAYETLSRSERKGRHLAVAAYLERTWTADEDEVVEVLAAHLLDAYSAQPDADDAPALRERAGRRLVEAGERAASLGAHEEAERYFRRAVELAESDLERARLVERIAEVVGASGRAADAGGHFERAGELFAAAGEPREAGRISARVSEVLFTTGRLEEAAARIESAYAELAGVDDAAFAAVAAETGRMRLFKGQLDMAFGAARAKPRDRRTRPARSPDRTVAQHEGARARRPWPRRGSPGSHEPRAGPRAVDRRPHALVPRLPQRRLPRHGARKLRGRARTCGGWRCPCAPARRPALGGDAARADDRSALHARPLGRGARPAGGDAACGPGERASRGCDRAVDGAHPRSTRRSRHGRARGCPGARGDGVGRRPASLDLRGRTPECLSRARRFHRSAARGGHGVCDERAWCAVDVRERRSRRGDRAGVRPRRRCGR